MSDYIYFDIGLNAANDKTLKFMLELINLTSCSTVCYLLTTDNEGNLLDNMITLVIESIDYQGYDEDFLNWSIELILKYSDTLKSIEGRVYLECFSILIKTIDQLDEYKILLDKVLSNPFKDEYSVNNARNKRNK